MSGTERKLPERTARRRLIESVRGYFFAAKRQKESDELSATVRGEMFAQLESAQRRLEAARVLLEAGLPHDSLLLYREGSLRLARAFVALKDRTCSVADIAADALFRRVAALVEEDELSDRRAFSEGWSQLEGLDPTRVDQLPAAEAKVRCQELDRATRCLADRVEPRSPSQLKQSRNAKLAVAVFALLAIPVARQVWLLTPRNISYHKRTIVSSEAPNMNPQGVVDDYLYGSHPFQSLNEVSPWLAIDLGKRYMVSDARIFGRHDCCFDESVPLAFEVSDDGMAYRTVATKTDPFVSLIPWRVNAVSTPARFVRLRTLRPSVLYLCEVQVYGRELR